MCLIIYYLQRAIVVQVVAALLARLMIPHQDSRRLSPGVNARGLLMM
jgi:hypothetical protein